MEATVSKWQRSVKLILRSGTTKRAEWYSKKESTHELNYCLDMLQGRVFEAQREMMLKGIDITANKVKSFLLGKDIKDCKTILEVYKEHVEEIKALVGKEYAKGTLMDL